MRRQWTYLQAQRLTENQSQNKIERKPTATLKKKVRNEEIPSISSPIIKLQLKVSTSVNQILIETLPGKLLTNPCIICAIMRINISCVKQTGKQTNESYRTNEHCNRNGVRGRAACCASKRVFPTDVLQNEPLSLSKCDIKKVILWEL